MTKQEVIQQAYGDAWNTVQDYVNEDGWIRVDDPLEYLLSPESNGFERANIQWMMWLHSYDWRPISLDGIEDNNGWISMNDQVPKDGQLIDCFSFNAARTVLKKITYSAEQKESYKSLITHWKPYVDTKFPHFS